MREGTAELTLHAFKPEARATTDLIIRGSGYDSGADARRAGEDAKSALRATGVECHVPMDFGPDRPPGFFFNRARRMLEEQHEIQLEDDVHGLHVYEERGRPVRFGPPAVGVIQSWPVAKFVATLNDRLQRPPRLRPEVIFASDLYFLAAFEASPRARFVTLVTALEVLSTRALRPPLTLAHVERLITQTKEAGKKAHVSREQESLRSLEGSLNDLREQSITSAIGDLVREHVPAGKTFDGSPPATFAKRCYAIRSTLAHEGHHDACDQLLCDQLRFLVREVLLRLMG